LSFRISDTLVSTVKIVHYEQTNFMGRLHGGDMLEFLTDAGFLSASRFSRGTALLASLDDVSFRKPVNLGDVIVLEAEVDYVAHSSMEVTMRAVRNGEVVVEATGAYVHVDEFLRPTVITSELKPSGGDEEERYLSAKARRERRLGRIADRKDRRYDVSDPTEGLRYRLSSTFYVSPELSYDGRIMSAGKLLKIMDDLGGTVSLNYLGYKGSKTGPTVVTVGVNGFSFYSPIKVGDVVTVYAGLIYVGRKSDDVLLKVVKEDPRSGVKEHVATAVFSYVKIDESGRPSEMPEYVPSTEAERRLYQEALKRRESLGLLRK
jgi:acyl-CoA hydrolase